MECILWNKKKTPDYKYTFLGKEPILFVGELFNNSNCLITDANNSNKPVEDYEYGKVQKTDSIAFVEIYQQKYAVGRINISNYVYDNGSKCNVYYNEKLLDPNATNRIPSSIKPELLKITITKLFNDDNIYINYPIDNIEYNITNNHLIIKTKTGIYLGANGEEGYEIAPLEEIEIPVLLKTEDIYDGVDYWNEVLPKLPESSNNKISCTVTNSSGVSITKMINADTYTITYSLVDENTAWTNGTTSPIQYKYIIRKRKFKLFCEEGTSFTLNSNSTITKTIGGIDEIYGTDFPILDGTGSLIYPTFTIKCNYSTEILEINPQDGTLNIDFKANNIPDTDTAHVYVSLNMANYESSNKLDFNITLEPFNWENATWADLKELCKKGNLENNSSLQNQIALNLLSKEFSVTESVYTDTNEDKFSIPAKTYTAILINAYQKKMVFAISEPIIEKIPWSQKYNAGYYYMGTTVNGYCDAFKEQMNIKQYLSTPVLKVWEKDDIIKTYPTSSSPSHSIFPFSAMELDLPDSTFSSALIKRNDSIGNTNNMPLKNTSWYNGFSINEFWLRQFGDKTSFKDYWASANKNNNIFSISSNLENRRIGLVVGFIIDGEEETANG